MAKPEKILALCTVQAGLDTVAELLRLGVSVSALVGLHPDAVNPEDVSGWTDVSTFAGRWKIRYFHVQSYGLDAAADRTLLETEDFDLVLVCAWQRLVPRWLIDRTKFGVLGGHGSPDGIHGGRGRSPQNWALMLGCRRFDLSLFRITPGIDDGPVLATRSFSYGEADDIRVSYYRSALAMAEMINEVLQDPVRLAQGVPQPGEGFYYPQRRPDDGWVDWMLSRTTTAAHCRALTKPYPGLRTECDGIPLILWECIPFDEVIEGPPGVVSACFDAGEFLVNCIDGRVLIREWSAPHGVWRPAPGQHLRSKKWSVQLREIVARHQRKYPDLPVSPRILQHLDGM